MTLETYEKSVNVLINAYRTETLFHGSCSACAVGNLMRGDSQWRWSVGATDAISGKRERIPGGFTFVNITGMSIPELSEIERSFEMVIHNELLKNFTIEELSAPMDLNSNIKKIIQGYRMWISGSKMKEGQYLGLCAVLDVMAGMIEDSGLEGDRLVENSLVEDSLHKKELKLIATEFGVTV